MPALGIYNYVDVPAPEVAQGGVLRSARVVDVTDPHDLMGAQYLTDACVEGHVWEEFCTMTPAAQKVFDLGPDVVQGDPFVVYAGVECDFQRLDEGEERARRRLTYSERHQVDTQVRLWLDTEAVEIGDGPFAVNRGVGILESYTATMYGGVPLLLIGAGLINCLCQCLTTGLDGRLTTIQGNPVANLSMGSWDDPQGNAAATSWIYAVGQITLLRGPVQSYTVPQQLKVTGPAGVPRALAERIYVPLIECLAAKVEVTCQ